MEVVEEADWRHLSFAEWLRVVAPVYARLYLPSDDRGRYPPVREAIFDLRAAMMWTEELSDHPQDVWDWCNCAEEVRGRARETLARFGLLMPSHLFDAVWRLCEDFERDPDTIWREAHAVWDQPDGGLPREVLWRLLWAAHDALRIGPEQLCRRRYRCEPDAA